MDEIPSAVAEIDYEGRIPQEVAELPQEFGAEEDRPYFISFEKYNDKLCEIQNLSSNKGRRAVEMLKDIGTKIFSMSDFQRHSIDRLPVSYSGGYKVLWRNLDSQIEIKELKLQQDARIFYFDIESKKILYIVAITENHLETEKVRR